MGGLGDGVDETLVGVGGEIDRKGRAGRRPAGHLDVQRHLAVGVLVLARRIGAARDWHGRHLGRAEPHGLERRGGVGGGEAAAELDQPHALALSVGVGKAVELGHLGRQVADGGRLRVRQAANLGRGDGALVQPQHRLDVLGHVRRRAEMAAAAAKAPAALEIGVQLGPERGLQGGQRAFELHQPPAGVVLRYAQPMLGGEGGQAGERRLQRLGATGAQLLAVMEAAGRRRGLGRGLQIDADLGLLVGVAWAHPLACGRASFAAGNRGLPLAHLRSPSSGRTDGAVRRFRGVRTRLREKGG